MAIPKLKRPLKRTGLVQTSSMPLLQAFEGYSRNEVKTGRAEKKAHLHDTLKAETVGCTVGPGASCGLILWVSGEPKCTLCF